MKGKLLSLVLLAGLVFGHSDRAWAIAAGDANAAFRQAPVGTTMLFGFWALGFGQPGVSTEFSVFADRTNTSFAVPIQIVFVDDKQTTVARFDDHLTAAERKSYDAEQTLIGTTSTVGFFLVADSNWTSSVLSGASVIGLDPSGSIEGTAKLLLDSSGNVITTSRALTGHDLTQKFSTASLAAPLGLTTLTPAGQGFQTFLVLLNAGTTTTIPTKTATSVDNSQPISIEFFGDNEVFLGSCDTTLTLNDVYITRPGLSPKLNDLCIPPTFKAGLVPPANTTARWAAVVRTHNLATNVLIGEVITVNTKSLEAYAYAMAQNAASSTTLNNLYITSLLITD
jgi:hypothetical protein